jgi:hypothetical protein
VFTRSTLQDSLCSYLCVSPTITAALRPPPSICAAIKFAAHIQTVPFYLFQCVLSSVRFKLPSMSCTKIALSHDLTPLWLCCCRRQMKLNFKWRALDRKDLNGASNSYTYYRFEAYSFDEILFTLQKSICFNFIQESQRSN